MKIVIKLKGFSVRLLKFGSKIRLFQFPKNLSMYFRAHTRRKSALLGKRRETRVVFKNDFLNKVTLVKIVVGEIIV